MTDKERIKQLKEVLKSSRLALINLQRQIPNDETLADFNFDLCEIAEQKYIALQNKENTSEKCDFCNGEGWINDNNDITASPCPACGCTRIKQPRPIESVYAEDEVEKFLIWYHGTESPFGTKGYFKNAFNDYNSDDEN